jgi:hypothetical protein
MRGDEHHRSLDDRLRASERECALQERGFGAFVHVRFCESRRAGGGGGVRRCRCVMPVLTSEDTAPTSHNGWSGFPQGRSEGVTGLLMCRMSIARATDGSDRGECRHRNASLGTGSAALA